MTHPKIKLIIAGGRDFNDYMLLSLEVKKFLAEIADGQKLKRDNLIIISGCAPGVDSLGEDFADQHWVQIERFPADWNKHGKSAGPIRNEEMAKNATHCIVFWDGKSRGSKNMIETAQKYNLTLKIVNY